MQQAAACVMTTYNAVTSGELLTNNYIEGSVLVGGNLTVSGLFNNRAPASPFGYVDGTISGSASGGKSLNIDSSGTLYYKTLAAGDNFTGNGTENQFNSASNPLTLSAYTNPLTGMSASLSRIARDSTQGNTITASNNELIFNVKSAPAGIAYFNISGTALQSFLNGNSGPISKYVFDTNPNVTTIINVTGNFSNATVADNVNFPTAVPQNVLFNFAGATTLDLSNWESAVLAPNAETTLSGNAFEGFIYTKDILSDANGIDDYLFTGSLPIPEPGSLSLLAAGLIALGVGRRRHRRDASARRRIHR